MTAQKTSNPATYYVGRLHVCAAPARRGAATRVSENGRHDKKTRRKCRAEECHVQAGVADSDKSAHAGWRHSRSQRLAAQREERRVLGPPWMLSKREENGEQKRPSGRDQEVVEERRHARRCVPWHV